MAKVYILWSVIFKTTLLTVFPEHRVVEHMNVNET